MFRCPSVKTKISTRIAHLPTENPPLGQIDPASGVAIREPAPTFQPPSAWYRLFQANSGSMRAFFICSMLHPRSARPPKIAGPWLNRSSLSDLRYLSFLLLKIRSAAAPKMAFRHFVAPKLYERRRIPLRVLRFFANFVLKLGFPIPPKPPYSSSATRAKPPRAQRARARRFKAPTMGCSFEEDRPSRQGNPCYVACEFEVVHPDGVEPSTF